MNETIHASTVAIGWHGILIEGPSGAGKSDLALRLIDRGAVLVSDDYTVVSRADGQLMASAPETIIGRIEVRGLGILRVPHVQGVPVAMIVRIETEIERMPYRGARTIDGIAVPEVMLDAREASAPIKVELALRRLLEGNP